jgi:hypothetical protein
MISSALLPSVITAVQCTAAVPGPKMTNVVYMGSIGPCRQDSVTRLPGISNRVVLLLERLTTTA